MTNRVGQQIENKQENFRAQFPSPSQSQPPEISLQGFGWQKNALFQKGLRERPETALLVRRPFSFSFRPVSPEGRDFANLVTGRCFVEYQWLEEWRRPGEFESANGWRRELGSE
jgi:hypothetical protein